MKLLVKNIGSNGYSIDCNIFTPYIDNAINMLENEERSYIAMDDNITNDDIE